MSAGELGLVFFSSRSGNTARFVEKLGRRAQRIPIGYGAPVCDAETRTDKTVENSTRQTNDAAPQDPKPADLTLPSAPYVLICPTYADGDGKGAVPKEVIRFLNNPTARQNLVGVVGAGNRNFGSTYALAGRIIAQKCNVPLLYSFELAGTETDIIRTREGLRRLETELCSTVT